MGKIIAGEAHRAALTRLMLHGQEVGPTLESLSIGATFRELSEFIVGGLQASGQVPANLFPRLVGNATATAIVAVELDRHNGAIARHLQRLLDAVAQADAAVGADRLAAEAALAVEAARARAALKAAR